MVAGQFADSLLLAELVARGKSSLLLECSMTQSAKAQSTPTNRSSSHVKADGRTVGGLAALGHDAMWTLAGNSVYLASQWVILVALAKWTSTDAVGIFTFALAVTAPIVMFLNLDLRSLLITDPGVRYHPADYLRLRRATVSLALGVVVLVSLLYPDITWEQRLVSITIGLAKAFESQSDIHLGIFQRAGLHKRSARSLAFRGVLSAAAVLLTVGFTRSILGAAVTLAVVWGLCYLVDRYATQSILREVHPESLEHSSRRMLSLAFMALPMGATMLLISFQTSLPRLLLESHASTSEQGIFSALSYPWALGSLLIRSVASVAAPRYRDHLVAKDWRGFLVLLSQMVGYAAIIGAAGILCAAAIGEPVLRLLYTNEYAAHKTIFVWLAIANGLAYLSAVVRHATVVLRRLQSYLGVTAVSTLLQAVAGFILIEPLGLLGAALSSVVLGSAQLIGTAILLVAALRVERAGARGA